LLLRAGAEIRATCHGISAAAGKLGAVIGSAALAPCLSAYGLSAVMFACGGVALLGAVTTVVFTKETMGVELGETTKGLVCDGVGPGANAV
jgi:PHS family inorganic phosphate transporter-like MFS transporter